MYAALRETASGENTIRATDPMQGRHHQRKTSTGGNSKREDTAKKKLDHPRTPII